jgi:hypothetical protein
LFIMCSMPPRCLVKHEKQISKEVQNNVNIYFAYKSK